VSPFRLKKHLSTDKKHLSTEIRRRIALSFLNLALPLFLIISIPACIVSVFPVFYLDRFAISFGAFILVVLGFIAKKRYSPFKVIRFLLPAVSLLLISAVFFNGGVRAPAYVGMLMVMSYVSWQYPKRITLIALTLYILLGGITVVLNHYNLMPSAAPPSYTYYWITYSLYFIVVTFMITYGNDMLHDALKESEKQQQLLSSVFSSLDGGLFIFSSDFQLLQCNFEAGELDKQCLEKYQTPILDLKMYRESEQSQKTLLEHLTSGGENINNETFKVSAAKPEWFTISVSPLLPRGRKTGMVMHIRNISEQIIREKNLQQAQKMDAIGQLSSGVAHDFNNMLGCIVGATEVLKDMVPDEAEEMLKIICDSSDKAAELTQKLLLFSRKGNNESSVCDLKETVSSAAFLLERTLDKKVKIQCEFKDNAVVKGNSGEIQNALINMGINASHAMPHGGTLTFRCSQTFLDEAYCNTSHFDIHSGNFMEIEVEDTGEGIAVENLSHIFEPFFTTKETGKGTGLGLAAVYGMIHKNSGAVSVYSEEKRGTTFHIFLPFAHEKKASEIKTKGPIEGGTEKILVIDDEKHIRLTAREMLRTLGYTIECAENGIEGLKLLQKESFDLVILDMVMPKMNGKETFAEIQRKYSRVKVILASGFSRDGDVQEMQKQGLKAFIRKPYRKAKLAQLIRKVLDE
jgi:signal transduction histidine kinase